MVKMSDKKLETISIIAGMFGFILIMFSVFIIVPEASFQNSVPIFLIGLFVAITGFTLFCVCFKAESIVEKRNRIYKCPFCKMPIKKDKISSNGVVWVHYCDCGKISTYKPYLDKWD
jgi:hypothetical protein